MPEPFDCLSEVQRVSKIATDKVGSESVATVGDLKSIAEVCKICSEVEKGRADSRHQERSERTESVRFWVPVGTSFASVLILALTLWAQSRQFRSTAAIQDATLRAQISANEDTSWRESIKIFADKPTLVSSAAGVASLEQFMESERHYKDARRLALSLLGQGTFAPAFKILFDAAYVSKFTDVEGPQATLDELISLNRQLTKVRKQLNNMTNAIADSHETMVPDSESDPAKPSWVPKEILVERENDLSNEVNTELQIVTSKMIEEIRKGAQTRDLDLSDTQLIVNSLKDIDLSHSKLSNTDLYSIDLTDTDLSEASIDDGLGDWKWSAWWKAKRISPSLLSSLRKNAAFPKGKTIFNGSKRAEYDADVKRLEMAK
jgi:hypothetical protein